MNDDTLIPVFDLGNVFVDWNPMYLFRKLFDTEEEAQWFHAEYLHARTGIWNSTPAKSMPRASPS